MGAFSGMLSGTETLSEALGFLGKIFADIVRNEYASYAIILIAIAAMTATVVEAALAKLPLFQGSSSAGNKGAKIVAWCFSAIGTTGMHWMFKDRGPGAIISAFGGSAGVFIIVGIIGFVWFSIYKNMENSRPGARRFWSTFVAGFVFFWLLGSIRGGENYLGSFLAINVIAGIIAGLSYFGGSR